MLLSFHDRRIAPDQAFVVIRKNVQQVFNAIPQYQPLDKLKDVGLIIELGFPTEIPPPELAKGLAANLYSGPNLGEIVSFELKLGFDGGNGLFTNLGFSLYEFRSGNVLGQRPPQQIDLRLLDVEERGLGVSIDVNNRPSATTQGYDPIGSFGAIMKESERLASGGYTSFLQR
jgi:hypothetical protein